MALEKHMAYSTYSTMMLSADASHNSSSSSDSPDNMLALTQETKLDQVISEKGKFIKAKTSLEDMKREDANNIEINVFLAHLYFYHFAVYPIKKKNLLLRPF